MAAQLMLSDISLRAAAEDGVMPVVDPALYGVTLGVLALAAIGLIAATRGRLGLDDPTRISHHTDELPASRPVAT